MLPDHKLLVVIIDITRLRRYVGHCCKLEEENIEDLIKYKLVKDNCVIVEGFDHRMVTENVIEALQQIRYKGGINIRLPAGVISVEAFTLRRNSIVLECSGCGGEFNALGTVRDQDAYLRSRVYGKAEGRRSPRRRY